MLLKKKKKKKNVTYKPNYFHFCAYSNFYTFTFWDYCGFFFFNKRKKIISLEM